MPSRADLERFFFLDDADKSLIGDRRGDHNRLGLMLQATAVRFVGLVLGGWRTGTEILVAPCVAMGEAGPMPLRDAGLEDGPGLTAALFEAANWDGRARFTRDQLLADPHMSHYVADWPRATDFGTVAVDDHGEMIGAAWCRLFDTIDQGYGFVAADIPELSIGVNSDHRGRGIGTALLDAVIAQAAGRGYRAVSLSVEDGNRARALYERAGFTVVGRNEGSATLVLGLRRTPRQPRQLLGHS